MSFYAACLSVCVLLGPAVPPPQGNSVPSPGRYAGYTRSDLAPANELLFRRESARAQQRAARIEARKWQGRSMLRPTYAPALAPVIDPSPWSYPAWDHQALRISFNAPLW